MMIRKLLPLEGEIPFANFTPNLQVTGQILEGSEIESNMLDLRPAVDLTTRRFG